MIHISCGSGPYTLHHHGFYNDMDMFFTNLLETLWFAFNPGPEATLTAQALCKMSRIWWNHDGVFVGSPFEK